MINFQNKILNLQGQYLHDNNWTSRVSIPKDTNYNSEENPLEETLCFVYADSELPFYLEARYALETNLSLECDSIS